MAKPYTNINEEQLQQDAQDTLLHFVCPSFHATSNANLHRQLV